MSQVDLKSVIREVEKFVKNKLDPGIKRELYKNISLVVRTVMKEDLAAVLIGVYDSLTDSEESEYGPEAKNRDPMSLKELRPLFVEQIAEELASIQLIDNKLHIEIGNREKWGYGKERGPEEGHPESVDILVYYIEGNTGEWGFISEKHYAKRRIPNPNLGRFGEGFMISKEDYIKEKWEKVTGLTFEDIKHPISGQKGFDGFHTAIETFDFSKYITEAVQLTFKNVKSLIG